MKPNGISAVTQRHLSRERRLRCRLSTDIKHCFTSTGLNPFSTDVAGGSDSTDPQLVPPLRGGDLKTVVVSASSKSFQPTLKTMVKV